MSLGKILIMDGGAYSFLGPFMARYYDTVYYHRLTGGVYHESPSARIGSGLPGVAWTPDPWSIMKNIDVIFFPDVNDWSMAKGLKSFGLPVCSSMGGAMMELDKYSFLTKLHDLGLPVAKTYLAEGLTDLWEYLKDKTGPLWLKNAHPERGDWETTKFINKWQLKKFLDNKRALLGERAETIEILVQYPIESECEFGIDTFMLDGELPDKVCGGYEIKDRGLIHKVFDSPPQIITNITDKLKPEYKKLGYAGPYSNEVRITKTGKAYAIDETCRCASPATATQLLMLGESYAKAIKSLAHNELPVIEAEYPYAAEMVLTSDWYRSNELHVGSVKELGKLNVFARNAISEDGQIYCVPNGDDEVFGSIAAAGKTYQEAIDTLMTNVEKLNIQKLSYDKEAFSATAEAIKCGEKWGIKF